MDGELFYKGPAGIMVLDILTYPCADISFDVTIGGLRLYIYMKFGKFSPSYGLYNLSCTPLLGLGASILKRPIFLIMSGDFCNFL